jgi:hypothetical protein
MDTQTTRHEADDTVDFVSLGMVILDDISVPNRELIKDVVGGSGAFCMMNRSHHFSCSTLLKLYV